MSGYFRADADEWQEVHYSARWTPEDPAPAWWVGLDIGWACARREIPSCDEAAATWGWSRSRAARAITALVNEQIAWAETPDEAAALTALMTMRRRGHPDGPRTDGFVYFIRSEQGGPVKIGTSLDPEARLRALQTSHPGRLLIIGRRPGGPREEARLHALLAAHRLTGEWFVDDAAVLEEAARCL